MTAAETRSERKTREILQAASAVFLGKGYDGTSMDEIAATAGVSKQTVYKHFADKETLFREVVLSTATQTNDVVESVTTLLADAQSMEANLRQLARRIIAMLLNEELLRLRRLIIANADRMPELGRSWYRDGFERMMDTMASCFERLTDRGLMRANDPHVAASHFFGMLLWIPMNEAMFTGNSNPRSKADLDRHADACVEAFLATYGMKRDS